MKHTAVRVAVLVAVVAVGVSSPDAAFYPATLVLPVGGGIALLRVDARPWCPEMF